MVVILLWSRMSVLRLVNFSSCSTLLITQTTIVRIRQTKENLLKKDNKSVQMFILLDGVEGEVDLDDCTSIGLRDFFGLAQVAIFFFAQDKLCRRSSCDHCIILSFNIF